MSVPKGINYYGAICDCPCHNDIGLEINHIIACCDTIGNIENILSNTEFSCSECRKKVAKTQKEL